MAVPSAGSHPHTNECPLPARFEPIGRIVVEEGIGSCEARDAHAGRDVLLKFGPGGPVSESHAHSGILHEYRVLSHFAHPSITRVLDLVLEPSYHCLCLESGKGYSELPKWIDGGWSVETFRVWLDSLLSVLEHIHGMGLVHCNLTPRTVTVPIGFASQQASALRVTGFHRSKWSSEIVLPHLSPSAFFFPSSESLQIPGPSLDLFSVGALAAHVLSGNSDTEADDGPDALSILHKSLRPFPTSPTGRPPWLKSGAS